MQYKQIGQCTGFGMLVVCAAFAAAIRAAPGDSATLLILTPRSDDVTQTDCITLGNVLAAEAEKSWSGTVLTWDDLSRFFEYEAHKQLLGCEKSECIAELAGLTGSDFVITGELAAFGSVVIFNLRLIDAASLVTRGRISATGKGNIGGFVERAGPMIRKLCVQSESLAQKPVAPVGSTVTPPRDTGERIPLRPDLEKAMTWIPSGSFRACSTCKATIAMSGFWMDRTEVSNREYEECVKSGKCIPAHYSDSFCRPGSLDYLGIHHPGDQWSDLPKSLLSEGSRPVVCVTWEQASLFCKQWRGGRLPTAAEWLYAAQGGSGRIPYWGHDWLDYCPYENAKGWIPPAAHVRYPRLPDCHDTSSLTMPVGVMPPNRFGLSDMLGNAQEWVYDGIGNSIDTVFLQSFARKNPFVPWNRLDGSMHRKFGISWYTTPEWGEDEWMGKYNEADEGIGFRCVMAKVHNDK
jgi:formylglycine-generating enzyme required for sulfatase activity